ncbi:uncharacterized protein L203_102572 [Cryptococcus depauperatus CBS 7841]|uniref:Uncharacterized protein n=1 Tax=Cryptococcus depauperatus CBS 7841 TaxID=1295531 RepID=A0A1E3IDM0_9TREE|nr:hypothetical protein L203_03935 [Cryptococcus depauperatus CBS 7841]ODO04337.1 hypothetical protein L204_00695 [Cryptococcus depauperatus CBS 7855]
MTNSMESQRNTCSHHRACRRAHSPPVERYDDDEKRFYDSGPVAILPSWAIPHSRPHPYTPSYPLHNVGFGPAPLFGWGSVTPQPHTYGVPKYFRYQKPDYRRFCYSVGKAEVPYASLPGGPLFGLPSYMAEQLVRR